MIDPLGNKSVTILGATGSIGMNTLDVLQQAKENYCLEALTAGKNADGLIALAKKHQPKYVAIADESQYHYVKDALAQSNIEVSAGEQAVLDIASRPVDIVMAAIVGVAGLAPTRNAIRHSKTVALANKECLVCAGSLLMKEAQAYHTTIVPVDSEHNAIFQVFNTEESKHINTITLTASGGPFADMDPALLAHVTPEQAIKHPNWQMGKKISVDSATMVNKGLEIIEAYHLFPVEKESIDAVLHRQSIVHGLVEYEDGSILAQLGTPDMRTPIAVALAWPQRMKVNVPKLNLMEIGSLNFEPIDEKRFPAFSLAKHALAESDAATTIFNMANEIAVEKFLNYQLPFSGIAQMIEAYLAEVERVECQTIEEVSEYIEKINASSPSYSS